LSIIFRQNGIFYWKSVILLFGDKEQFQEREP
jgi:hypothetical protein